MVKPDEKRLIAELRRLDAAGGRPYAREVAAELDIPAKRAAYILSKWADRGLWDYGVHVLAGWFTDAGRL